MNSKIRNHFKRKDPVLFSWIERVEPVEMLTSAHPDTYFYRLCREVVYQQLSDKAGDAIFLRFKNLFPDSKKIVPRSLLELHHETIRSSGISNAKARYLKNIAEAIVNKTVDFKNLKRLSDEQAIEELTKIKGVGRWTAEMFLMFTLGRENIFSLGDQGLKNGMKKVYGLKKYPSTRQTGKLVEKWSPFKTYGCLVLWGSLKI